VLVYEGTPEFIQQCLTRRGLKGSVCLPKGIIREAIVGDFLETLIPVEQAEPATFSNPTGKEAQ
jgi:hypothetical protein